MGGNHPENPPSAMSTNQSPEGHGDLFGAVVQPADDREGSAGSLRGGGAGDRHRHHLYGVDMTRKKTDVFVI